jgi:hypothetical protein
MYSICMTKAVTHTHLVPLRVEVGEDSGEQQPGQEEADLQVALPLALVCNIRWV